jgi:hypothetical protein
MEHASVYGFSNRKSKPSLKASTTSKKKKKEIKKTTRGSKGAKDEDDAFNFDTLPKGIAAGNVVLDSKKKSKVTTSTDPNKLRIIIKDNVDDEDGDYLQNQSGGTVKHDDNKYCNSLSTTFDDIDDIDDVKNGRSFLVLGTKSKTRYLVADAVVIATATDRGLSAPVAKSSSHNDDSENHNGVHTDDDDDNYNDDNNDSDDNNDDYYDCGLSAPVAKSSSHNDNDVDVPALLTKSLSRNDDDSHNDDGDTDDNEDNAEVYEDNEDNDEDNEDHNDDYYECNFDLSTPVAKSYDHDDDSHKDYGDNEDDYQDDYGVNDDDYGDNEDDSPDDFYDFVLSAQNNNDNESLSKDDYDSSTRSFMKCKDRTTQINYKIGRVKKITVGILLHLLGGGNAIKSSRWNNDNQDDDNDFGQQRQRNLDNYIENELDQTNPEHMQRDLMYGIDIPNPIASQIGSSIGNSYVTPPRQSSIPLMPSNENHNQTNSWMDHEQYVGYDDYDEYDDYQEEQNVLEAMDISMSDAGYGEQDNIHDAIEKSLCDLDPNRFIKAEAVSSRKGARDILNNNDDNNVNDKHHDDDDYGNRTPGPLKTDRSSDDNKDDSSDDNKDSLDIIPPSTNSKPPPPPRLQQASISTLFPTTNKKKSSNWKTLRPNSKPPPPASMRTPRSTASGSNSPFQQATISDMFPTVKKSSNRKTLRPNSRPQPTKPPPPASIRTPRSRSTASIRTPRSRSTAFSSDSLFQQPSTKKKGRNPKKSIQKSKAVEENRSAVDNDECTCVAKCCCCCIEPQKRQQSHGKRPRRSSDDNNSDDNNPSKPKSSKKPRRKKSQSDKPISPKPPQMNRHQRKSPPTTHHHLDNNYDVSKLNVDDCIDADDDDDDFDWKGDDDDFDWKDDDEDDDDDDDEDVIYDTIHNPSSETYADIDDQANHDHDQDTNGPNEYMYGYTPDVRYSQNDLLPREVETEYEHVRYSRIEDHTPLLTHAGTPFDTQRHINGGFLVSAHPVIHLTGPPPPGHIRDGDFHPDMNGGILGAGRRIATVSATHTSDNAMVGCWDLPSVNVVSAVQHVYQNHRPALAASDNMVALIFTPINMTDDNRFLTYRNFPRNTHWARSMHPVYSLVDVPASASDVVVFNISDGVPYQLRGAMQSRWMVPLRTLEQKRESRKRYQDNKKKDYESGIAKNESDRTEAECRAILDHENRKKYYDNKMKDYNSAITKNESDRTEAERGAAIWYKRRYDCNMRYNDNKRKDYNSAIAKSESDRTEADRVAILWRETCNRWEINKRKDYNSAIAKSESDRTEADRVAILWRNTRIRWEVSKRKDYESGIAKNESDRTEAERRAILYFETKNRRHATKMQHYNSAINKKESDHTEEERGAVEWYKRLYDYRMRCYANQKKNYNSAIAKSESDRTEADQVAIDKSDRKKKQQKNIEEKRKIAYVVAMTKTESDRTEAENYAVYRKEYKRNTKHKLRKVYEDAKAIHQSERTESDQAIISKYECTVAGCITRKYVGCYCFKHATPCKKCGKKQIIGNDGLCKGCRGSKNK